MDGFFQVVAAVLLAVVLGLVVSRQSKESVTLLTLAVCSMAMCVGVTFLRPILDFLRQLQQTGQWNSEWVRLLLKAVGIGLIGELAALVCIDAGNAALGKTVSMLTNVVMLWLAVPLLQALLELVEELIGGV